LSGVNVKPFVNPPIEAGFSGGQSLSFGGSPRPVGFWIVTATHAAARPWVRALILSDWCFFFFLNSLPRAVGRLRGGLGGVAGPSRGVDSARGPGSGRFRQLERSKITVDCLLSRQCG
jgi:hypothetical protein